MEVTLHHAAEQLGVSVRQAQRLAAAGTLDVTRWVGRTALVDSDSVLAAGRTSDGAGRRWAARTAWAAFDLLETGQTDRLAGSQLSRLRSQLRTIDVDRLVHLASRRAVTRRYTQTRRNQEQLEAIVALSGTSLLGRALVDLGGTSAVSVAGRLGLAESARSGVEGYVDASSAEEVVRAFGLVADGEGSVVLRVSDEPVTVGWVTTCLDLAERGGTREASAARSMLDELLDRSRDRRTRVGP